MKKFILTLAALMIALPACAETQVTIASPPAVTYGKSFPKMMKRKTDGLYIWFNSEAGDGVNPTNKFKAVQLNPVDFLDVDEVTITIIQPTVPVE